MTGVFTVNSLGQVAIDFIYDGGWFQGELVVFNLEGMDAYQVGSLEYIQEAARRGLTNSNDGFIAISDRNEGARWGGEYNFGEDQGVKTFSLNAGDQFGLMLIQNTTAQDIYDNPTRIHQWGKTPLFSIPEANSGRTQAVAVDNNGTIAFEDIATNKRASDKDYQDFVVQIRGMDNDLPDLSEFVGPLLEDDWRNTPQGQEILTYTDRNHYSAGVFEVGDTGEVSVDFLYDGGWFQGEFAIFNLDGMEYLTPGSSEFILEAANRALSDSTQGYIITQDPLEGAKFDYEVSWEKNWNKGTYQRVKTYAMNPGDQFAVMLVQNDTVQSIVNNFTGINGWGKLPIFSLPEVNLGIDES